MATAVFARAAYPDREARDEALADWLGERGARLVVLAGYMELLGAPFLARFPGAVINVHPSLLPSFPGLAAIEQALAYGVKVFGVTVHFVDAGVDSGPVILQRAVELPDAREPDEVLAALRPLEHELLPRAVALFARGALAPRPAEPAQDDDPLGRGIGCVSVTTEGELMTDNASGIERAAPGEVRVRRALLSVSDKHGIVEFAQGLAELGVELVSTGGTARELAGAGVAVRAIEEFTGFPEMMDGRVKTLHARLYAGLLALRDDDEHLRAASEQEIEQVDLVCVNLYPFEQTVARGDATEAEVIENIDIGGPTMIRAAAKNSQFAAVVVDPGDYERVLAELRESDGRLTLETRKALAGKAFACTARYDAAIATWFAAKGAGEELPGSRRESYEKVMDLRYGENPHQRAAFYARAGAPTHLLSGVEQLHGKELSFNNLLDLAAARELVEEFEQPACAIVKHNNPCGCAVAETAQLAYERAFACDPESAYGGVIAINRPIDDACAEQLGKQFIEVLLAPGYDAAALQTLQTKKNVRLLELGAWPGSAGAGELEAKPVLGGQLVQSHDTVVGDA